MTAPRILVIDDNLMNRELASFILVEASFEVEAVEDGRAALIRIPQFQPEVVLMDMQLPGLDGLTLTRALKADPATRHILILAFTAYAMKGDEARMLEAGCDGYISKPIEIGSFAASIRRYLEARQ